MRHGVGLEEKVAFLKRPKSYPHAPDGVEAVQTHMAWVFLAGDEAFKLKKPVRYAYLDFSTLDRRREDCHREVRLNRRLAPDVYRGVGALLWNSDHGLFLSPARDDEEISGAEGGSPKEGETPGAGVLPGDSEEVVEWLVQMRRLRRDRMLDVLIGRGEVSSDDVREIVERLVPFYDSVPAVPMSPRDYRDRIRGDVEESRDEVRRRGADLPLGRLESLRNGLLHFVEERGDVLDARVGEDRIVEGHGDLRPEHICLEDGPVIIDCIEFKLDFRTVDPADDLAYLAVECARLGDPELGSALLEGYCRASGDDPPAELLDFYRSFRALLRAKIAIWHILDPELEDHHAKWVQRTREYLELALDFLPVA